MFKTLKRLTLAAAGVLLATGITHAADKPTEVRLDYAYYSPPSLVLKKFGWLEEDLKADGVPVKWVLSQGSNRALEFLNSGSVDFGSTAGLAAVLSKANGNPIKTKFENVAAIAASGASVCLCPRSNAFIGVGRAPLRTFLDAGVNVCLGTDGLCSNADLDPLGELEFLGEQGGHGMSLCEALALVLVHPARFFGLAERIGSLAPGREARFMLVPDTISRLFER